MTKRIDELNKTLDELESDVIKLIDVSQQCIDGELKDVLLFNSQYFSLTKRLNDVASDLMRFDKKRQNSIWEKFDSVSNYLDYIYDTSSIPINTVLVKNTIELQESQKNFQGIQLAVFSIVLTILAFVLTNAKVLAISEISFKNVLLINLSFILSADVLFSFIYLFMGPLFYSKKGGLRIFSFIILPIILIIAIVVIALFMNGPI